MLYVENRAKYCLYACSLIILILSMIFGLKSTGYQISNDIVPIGKNALATDTIISSGIVLSLIPIASVSYINHRYLKSVEKNIPRFLRDILQRTDSGLILPKALIEAAKLDYGPVSFEIGIAMTRFELGYDFKASIMGAAKKLRHSFASQAALIISEAYSSGGKTHEVLSSSVALFNDLEQYNEQRQSELRPYTQLIYISIAIYLIIALIIISQFVIPISTMAMGTSKIPLSAPSVGDSLKSNASIPDPSYFVSIFFLSAVLESIFGGLVVGKIVDGSALAGLRHSLLLIAIAIVLFNLPI